MTFDEKNPDRRDRTRKEKGRTAALPPECGSALSHRHSGGESRSPPPAPHSGRRRLQAVRPFSLRDAPRLKMTFQS